MLRDMVQKIMEKKLKLCGLIHCVRIKDDPKTNCYNLTELVNILFVISEMRSVK